MWKSRLRNNLFHCVFGRSVVFLHQASLIVMSLYNKKHGDNSFTNGYNKSNSYSSSRNYNGWTERVKLTFGEGQFIENRELSCREDENGDRVRYSDDKGCEVLPLAITKPKSGGSVRDACRDKRGMAVFVKLGNDWVACTQRGKVWEKIITTEMTDAQMQTVAKVLGKTYRELGVHCQGLYDFIDHEEQVKVNARSKKLGPRGRAALQRHLNADDDDDDVADPFMDAFNDVDTPCVGPNPLSGDTLLERVLLQWTLTPLPQQPLHLWRHDCTVRFHAWFQDSGMCRA